MDAFVSHSSVDVSLAKRIERSLERGGLAVWLDRSEIRLGRLLRNELQAAIRDSRVLVLIWSSAAARSRWVAAEILSAFHLGRFILACVRDETPLPYFLQNTIYLAAQPRKTTWLNDLARAVREVPDAANEIPAAMGTQTSELAAIITRLVAEQAAVLDSLGKGDLAGARRLHTAAARRMEAAERTWPLESSVLNLGGYHRKNGYMVEHWEAIAAGRPPRDPLLEDAERKFYESLFVYPYDYSSLNGLGSVLVYGRDLEAAEFFIGRALALAKREGVDYPDARHDLELVQSLQARDPRHVE